MSMESSRSVRNRRPKYPVRFAAALAGLAAMASCSSGDALAPVAAKTPVETCVAFSYGTLRGDVRESVPKTAEAIRRLLPTAYKLRFGRDIPAELVDTLSATSDPVTGKTQSIEEIGEGYDKMFAEAHPGLGDNGPVADDRSSICYTFDLDAERVTILPGSYVLPFTYPGSIGQEPLEPKMVSAGMTAPRQ